MCRWLLHYHPSSRMDYHHSRLSTMLLECKPPIVSNQRLPKPPMVNAFRHPSKSACHQSTLPALFLATSIHWFWQGTDVPALRHDSSDCRPEHASPFNATEDLERVRAEGSHAGMGGLQHCVTVYLWHLRSPSAIDLWVYFRVELGLPGSL